MLPNIYAFIILLTYGMGEVLWSDSTHCPEACTKCESGPEICVVTPVLMQFSCLCLLHHGLCNGFAQNAVFYVGKCNPQPYFHLEHPEVALYSFRGTEVVPLRLREKIHRVKAAPVPQYSATPEPDDAPQMRLMDLRGDNRRSVASPNIKVNQPTVSTSEICAKFFKEDKMLQKTHKMKHFMCPNANPTMIQRVPLASIDKETEE